MSDRTMAQREFAHACTMAAEKVGAEVWTATDHKARGDLVAVEILIALDAISRPEDGIVGDWEFRAASRSLFTEWRVQFLYAPLHYVDRAPR